MKTEIRYYTQTGNTKKLAEAIAQVTGTKAETVDVPLTEETDILFLCNSVYWGGVKGQVKNFVKDNAKFIKKIVNVSTAALISSTYSQMKKISESAGVELDEKEFHCRGKFTALHGSHPDEKDIEAVKEFASWFMEDSPEQAEKSQGE